MSKYALPAILSTDIDTARSAEIGVEKRAYYSYEDIQLVGKVEQDAVDVGTWTADTTYSAPSGASAGYDLQCVLTAALRPADDTSPTVLTFDAILTGGAITSSTSASPGVITTADPHNLTNGDIVNISGVTGVGATALNGTNRTVTVISPTTFSAGINTTGVGTGGSFEVVGQATATFAPAASATDQTTNLPQALAVDIETDDDRKVKSISGLVTLDNGGAGGRYQVVAMPDSDTFTEIGCVRDCNPAFPSPETVKIPCRYQYAAWVKKGRDKEYDLSFSAVHRNFDEGFTRLNGHKVTMKIEVRKEDRILSERMVFGGYRPSISKATPDGNAEATDSASGSYETCAVFC